MKYDFDTIYDRRRSDAGKWAVGPDELPMWVADMDFKTAPEVISAMQERLDHGIFGYGDVPDEWYQAYISWWKRRHGFEIKKEWLVFCTGVVPAISSAVRKLTSPNENVVIQTPVYNIFFNSIINNGCRVLESPLVYENGGYSTDFEDLEKKLSDPQTSLMILCNPHNPVGKIWPAEELAKIAELADKYHVTVISDEIHCDITEPGKDYVPFASVSETAARISVTCISPTKCFNLAGLQTAAVCVPDEFLRHKMWRALNTDEVAEPNSFAVCAAVAAFNEGEAWLTQLREYISENRRFTESFIKEKLPEIKMIKAEATYLAWLDISALSTDSEEFAESIRRKSGLYLSAGAHYGESGKSFLRLNMACPRGILKDGLERLYNSIDR